MRTRILATAAALLVLGAVPLVASAATPSAVTIDISVVLSGNLEASTTRGSFAASGAIADAGTELGQGWFAGQGHLRTGEPNSLHSTVTLVGTDGTITIDLVGLFGHLPAPLAEGEGRWVVSGGTGAYADLKGRGSWSALADFRQAMAQQGPPRVTFQLTGTVN